MYDFAEASADPIHRLAQIKALVVLLHSTKHQRTVRVYPQVLSVLVRDDVAIIAGFLAASAPPRHRRRRKSIRVTMENQPRHPFRGTDVLRLHHPTGWHCYAVQHTVAVS